MHHSMNWSEYIFTYILHENLNAFDDIFTNNLGTNRYQNARDEAKKEVLAFSYLNSSLWWQNTN